jgi:D-arabinono-1,4-lactone oxidase
MTTGKLALELEKLDPAVPFHAARNHAHHTWARTFLSRPELYIKPQTLDEIQKVVNLARRCRRRIVVVGCGHSPSDLTCTSSWMVNLDDFNSVLKVDVEKRCMTVQAGIRLHQLNQKAAEYGLTIRNLGSIDQQSIAGAIATATHGSSLRHGLLAENIRSLKIVLANGNAVRCSAEQNEDLFRAALVSLGALGIIVEVDIYLGESCDIEWEQCWKSMEDIYSSWEGDLWKEAEFTRVWWMPYYGRCVLWQAKRTSKPHRKPQSNWYGNAIGHHTYHMLLWIANYVPFILPTVEWFVFGMQYGFSMDAKISAVEEQRTGLLMNCLYSQFVNEWALPLEKGPEAIQRLSAWINGDERASGIPFSSKGLYVHSPVEVRISDTSKTETPRPYLDNTNRDGPTLYLNATLYRPYLRDPPCRERYYEAFEWLMKNMGAKPHWAKNFTNVTKSDIAGMYGSNLEAYLKVRNNVDPDGMFVGEWHRRYILPDDEHLPLEEVEKARIAKVQGDGIEWIGEQAQKPSDSSPGGSEESFDIMAEAEGTKSLLLPVNSEDDGTVHQRFHGNPENTFTGTRVFDKM